jgi:hypothetical protein
MEPVLFEVPQVVEEVMSARDEAEGDESQDGRDDQGPVEDVLGEDERGEDEEVLDPLLGSESPKELHHRVHDASFIDAFP